MTHKPFWKIAYAYFVAAAWATSGPSPSYAIAFTDTPISISATDKSMLVEMNCAHGSSVQQAKFTSYQRGGVFAPEIYVTAQCAPHSFVSGHPVRLTVYCSQNESPWQCMKSRSLLEFTDESATVYLDTEFNVPLNTQLMLIKDYFASDHSSERALHTFVNGVDFHPRMISDDRWSLDSVRGSFIMVRKCQSESCRFIFDGAASTFTTP